MADSEITTCAPSVTRRTLLVAGVGAFTPTPFRECATVEVSRAGVADAAISLWRQWRSAYETAALLCQKQQQLETQLMKLVRASREIGGSRATEPTPARGEGGDPAHRVAADLASGYSEAKAEEERAAEIAQELADALSGTPASSLEGVAAKLHAVLLEGEWREDCPEFPWPHIRSALTDLIRIGGLGPFPEF